MGISEANRINVLNEVDSVYLIQYFRNPDHPDKKLSSQTMCFDADACRRAIIDRMTDHEKFMFKSKEMQTQLKKTIASIGVGSNTSLKIFGLDIYLITVRH